MKIEVHKIGKLQNKVIVIDDFLPNPENIVKIAEKMQPFPPEKDLFYPGIRRYFEDEDIDALEYMHELIEGAIPIIKDEYPSSGLSLTSIAFSVLTTMPSDLKRVQTFPHFDSGDKNDIAILHYLNKIPNSGTAFYRHRATGLEMINMQNKLRFINAVEQETLGKNPKSYIDGDSEFFEEIARFESKFNRVLIYQGTILHSAIVNKEFSFSPNPPDWRLTTTCFLKLDE